MKHSDGRLQDELYWQAWQPDMAARGVVLLAHGLAEHSGRYAELARVLTDAGFALFAVDHEGHGQSPGRRCAVAQFSTLIGGMMRLEAHARSLMPDLPVSLLGHSMGGLIAALTALDDQRRYRALLLSGPAIIAPEPPPRWQEWLLRRLARWLPNLPALALDANEISRDPAVVDAYRADPLVYNGKIAAAMVVAIFDAMTVLRERAGELTLPLLAMHGELDKLTAPEGSRELIENAASDDKTLTIWPGLRHEIFNEPEGDEVMQAATAWLVARH